MASLTCIDYELEIKNNVTSNDYNYIEIENEDSKKKIYDLLINHITFDSTVLIEVIYLAYYHFINKNYDLMKKYYLIGIDQKCSTCITNLGNYYEQEKDYEQMEKYYLMGIDNGDIYAMVRLGIYYKNINNNILSEKYCSMCVAFCDADMLNTIAQYYRLVIEDYIKMEEYYLLAIEKGNANAMNNLAHYYHATNQKHDEMIKYYQMGISSGNATAMSNLGYYYEIKKDYEQMKKYYLMGIEHDDTCCVANLCRYYVLIQDHPNVFKYCEIGLKQGDHKNIIPQLRKYCNDNNMQVDFLKIYIKYLINTDRLEIIELFNTIAATQLQPIEESKFFDIITSFKFMNDDNLCVSLKLLTNTLKYNISLLDLHFNYAPGGQGFINAKQNFFNICINK